MKLMSKLLRPKRSSSENHHRFDRFRRDEFPPIIRFHWTTKSMEIDSIDEEKEKEKEKEKGNSFSSDIDQSLIFDSTFSSNISTSTSSSQSCSSHLNNRSNDLFKKDPLMIRRSILVEEKENKDEEFVLKHREKLLFELSKRNIHFEDKTFPSTNQSIFINGISFSSSTIEFSHQLNSPSTRIIHQQILWLRPEEILSSNHSDGDQWTIFRDPKPNDVIQGALGDCWFITALSVIAERPEYLIKILTTKQINKEGIYYLRLCQDGQWTQVLIDDRFPCRMDRKLIFSQSRRKQLWVPLIEKALAKLNGTYESIVAGRCCEGLSIVSGSPCETFYLGSMFNPDEKCLNLDDIWIKLIQWKENRFLMCAMCANKSIEKNRFDRSGLSNNHAYSIQDFQEFSSTNNEHRYRFVKLRNPWGGFQSWKGEDRNLLEQFHLIDSNNNEEKHNEMKKKQRKGDGVFWIPFRSFVEYFESIDICKIRPHWFEVRDQGEFRFHSLTIDSFLFELKEETQLDLTLYRIIRQNQRFLRTNLTLSISVVNIEQQTNDHWRIYSIPIQSQRGQHKFISTSGILSPGFYYILPFLFDPIIDSSTTSTTSIKEENPSFNLSIHSSLPIDLQRCSLPSRIQREFLIKLCLFYGELISNVNSVNKFVDDRIRLYQLKNYWDGFILLVENRSSTENLHFSFHCSASQNAHLSRKDSQHRTRDVIPPRHRQIILICSRKNPSHTFTLIHEFHWEMSTQNFFKISSTTKLKHWPIIDESNNSVDLHLPQRMQT